MGSLSNRGRIFRGEKFKSGGGGDFLEGGADLRVGEGKGGIFRGGGQTFKLTS